MKKSISLFTALAISLGIVSPIYSVSAETIEITTATELQAALTNGGSYKISEDIAELDCSEVQLQIRNSVELDLNGADITVDNDGFNLQNYELTVTIKDGEITGTGNYGIKAMAKTPGTINLENVIIEGAKNGVAVANSDYTVNITGGAITGTSMGIMGNSGYFYVTDAETAGISLKGNSTLSALNSSITGVGNGITGNAGSTVEAVIDGCTVAAGENNFGVYWASSGKLEIKNSSISCSSNGKGVIHANGTTAEITLTNNTVSNTTTAANKAYVISNNSTDASKIYLDGGVYTGVFALNTTSTAVLNIASGMFSSDPSKYVTDGFCAVLNSDGMYEVVDASTVTEAPTTTLPENTTVPEETTKPDNTAEPSQTETPTMNPELAVDEIFTSNMVFQREKPIKISGSGKSGNVVTVEFNGSKTETVIEGELWSVTLPESGIVKSADMTITSSDGNEIVLTNIAVGDVILVSGQSNIFRDFNSFRVLATEVDADYPDIRLFSANTMDNGWQVATQENAKNFSALGFMTGKRLFNNTDGEVPIGLIRAAYDGSNIVAWVNNAAFAFDPDLYNMYNSSKAKLQWYTAYVKAIQKLNIGAAMWYQGEGNSWYKNNNYEKAMTMLIDSWRDEWNDQELPFVVVQLPTADFGVIYGNRTPNNTGGFSTGIGVRDGQWQVSQKMENVTTVVTIDTGRKTEVHPQDKQPIADRAAKVLEHYLMDNNDIAYLSPSYERMEITDGKAVIYFNNVYDKLISKDGSEIKGFMAAGEDGIFNPVNAQISEDGQTVIVDTTGIENPNIRYAWSDIPSLDESNAQLYSNMNLVNESGFAVAPFRTDTGKYMYYLDDEGNAVNCNFSPWIREITPGNGSIAESDVTFTIKADDVDGTVERVEVFVDDESVGQAEKSGDVWSKTISGLVDGTHTVYAVATDDNGAMSTIQDGSMGTTTQILYPKREAFLVGNGAERIDVSLSSSDDIKEYITVSGDSAAVETGSPEGYYRDAVKLIAGAAKHAAAVTLPVNADERYNVIRLDTNVYIDSTGSGKDSATSFEVIMNDGTTKPLLSFTATSLRIGGNYYEILKNTKENGKWYNLKLEVDIYRGLFSMWLDGEAQFINQSWIYQAKDFDKQFNAYQSLKTGVKSFKITHTQSAADIETATYVDGTRLSLTSYGDSSEPVETTKPTLMPTEKPDSTPEPTSIPTEPTQTPDPDNTPTADVRYEDGIIKAEFTNINTDGVIYIAEYDNEGRLIGAKLQPLSENVNINYEKTGEEIRVYVWNLKQKPLFNVFVLR